MKNTLKRCLAAAVAAVLVSMTFAGCNDKPDKQSTTEEVNTPIDIVNASPEELLLPIETETDKLTIAVILNPPQGKSSFNEIPLFTEYEKRTGLDIEFTHVTQEKMNLLFASNDLPDIVINYWADGQEKTAFNNEQILRLDGLMSKYAPNYVNLLKNDPSLYAQSVDADGFTYTFKFLRNNPELRVFDGFMIRQDWLDKLGLKMPSNLDELYNLLKAIKEGDPNGNGQKDEIPFIMEKGTAIDHLSSWWGMGEFIIDENDKIQNGWTMPEYKEMLQFLNKLYNEGLLDADYAISDRNQFDTKISNGQAAMWFGLAGGGLARISTLMAPIDSEFKLSAIPWLENDKGIKYAMDPQYTTAATTLGLAITTNCKDPKAAIKFADYAYSKEGQTLISFGVEGESYTMKNGVPTYTELITSTPGKSMSEMLGQYTLASGYPSEQSMDYFDQAMNETQKAAISVWKDGDVSRIVPVLKYTNEELPVVTTKFNEIKNYNIEMINKFITGRESFDEYDKYQSTLKSMGIEDVVKIKQTAYERYKDRLSKIK